jgi:phosphorylase/glycogen(starch) synthase
MNSTNLRFRGASKEFSVRLQDLNVDSPLPARLQQLSELGRANISWSWNPNFVSRISSVDPKLWTQLRGDLNAFLKSLSLETLQNIANDSDLCALIDQVVSELQATEKKLSENQHSIAYFCMEFGLNSFLNFYSGGLGVLAGDHLKTASDYSWNLCAIGLAYSLGYFKQKIESDGRQVAEKAENIFERLSMLPVMDKSGQRLKFQVKFPGRKVFVQAWKVGVGSIPLYLLDTDISENSPEDRQLTDHLYGGDNHHRLKQEILLGVGGYWLLKSLGRRPEVYHLNEGHAAFLVWSRMIDLVFESGLNFDQALEFVHQTSVFTTHTPVPAGHDKFSDEMIKPYLEVYSEELKCTTEQVSRLGKLSISPNENSFSMTDLALRGSSFVNGVSKIHGRVAREMFHEVYPGLHVSEVPVKGITNGVHIGTWLSREWQNYFDSRLGEGWLRRDFSGDLDKALEELSSREFWSLRMIQKKRLLAGVRDHVRNIYQRRGEKPAHTAAALSNINERALVIGFARRFAPYKRPNLLFQHIENLESMIRGGFPIVLLYAGKAHPSDREGQEMIRQIIEMSRRPIFAGRILFLENYDIHMAQYLVQGCDLWLNTPTRPLEASGTSGMKAAMNGTLNLSVDDGWWSEGYNGKNGWLISDTSLNEDPGFQREYDSAQIYSLLESEILPMFFDRNARGVPEEWVARSRESIRSTLWNFSTLRMLKDYDEQFITKARRNYRELSQDSYRKSKDLALQKQRLLELWPKVEIETFEAPISAARLQAGESCHARAKIKHPMLSAKDLCAEIVVGQISPEGYMEEFSSFPMKSESQTNDTSLWSGDLAIQKPGKWSLGLRVIPRLEVENDQQRLFMNVSRWY